MSTSTETCVNEKKVDTCVNEKKIEKKSNEFTKSVTVSEAVRDLVQDVNNTQRENEINRILKSLKINPIQILQLSLDLDEKNIKKQYRKLSLLVHPDKCPQDLKENAQRAFTMLNNCKKDLESKDFIIKLKHQINEARKRVIERKMIEKGREFISQSINNENDNHDEPPHKKQKTDANSDVSNAKPPQLKSEPTENEIKIQLREILIDCAWQKRIEDQVSQKLEQQTLARREELKAQRAAEKQYKKEWEDGRNDRVNNWRNWQNDDKKKKKKKKKKRDKLNK